VLAWERWRASVVPDVILNKVRLRIMIVKDFKKCAWENLSDCYNVEIIAIIEV
jgi:hypothetical protein